MVGGGQLARMTHQAAIALGQSLRVLATAADEPAALVAPDVVIGSHTEIEDLRRVAAGADVLTFDHEHVPNELLEKLVAEGVNVAPPPQALVHAQDKLVMRRRLEALGVPVPRYAGIGSVDELDAFARRIAGPVVVKAVRGGYDGRGVRMARDPLHAREIAAAFLGDGVPVMAEEQVNLRRELSALVARSPFGQGAAWPVVETVQRDGICVQVIAPAPELPGERAASAQQLALRLAAELGVVGVLAVELFETVDGELLVNELAMRPHSQRGAATAGAGARPGQTRDAAADGGPRRPGAPLCRDPKRRRTRCLRAAHSRPRGRAGHPRRLRRARGADGARPVARPRDRGRLPGR